MNVWIVALVAMVLLAPDVSAYYFQEYSVDVVLDSEVSTTVRAVLLADEPLSGLNVRSAEKPLSVSATVGGEPAVVEITGGPESYTIGIQSSRLLTPNVLHEVVIVYKAAPELERTSRGTLYNNAFTPAVAVQKYELSVTLPPGATIVFENDAPLISPTASLSTDGQRVRLFWKDTLGANQPFTALVVFEEEGDNSVVLLLGIAVAVGIIAFLTFRRKKTVRPQHKRIQKKPAEPKPAPVNLERVRKMLSEDENRILDIIEHYQGKALQSDVVRETHFSKAKVSKMIRGLEMKGVIVKIPYGKTNILKLKE